MCESLIIMNNDICSLRRGNRRNENIVTMGNNKFVSIGHLQLKRRAAINGFFDLSDVHDFIFAGSRPIFKHHSA